MLETKAFEMKKYHVYGMGNALVDMEFKVEDQFIESNEVKKGLMTLVEEARQTELLSSLGRFPLKKACGGSAANSVIAISQFGGNSYYSCKVASDEMGKFYVEDLQNEGVATNQHPGTTGTTGKCLVMVTPDAERTMNTYLGITATYGEDEINQSELELAEYLYIEGYLVATPTGKTAAIKAREHAQKNGVKVALSLSDPSMVEYFHDGLLEIIGEKVDLIFCNEKEAYHFVGENSLEDASRKLRDFAHTFAITLGEQGALIYDGENYHQVAPHKVEAVDSNGAGDMFAGAFLYGITHGHSYPESAALASRAAAEVVTHFGPRIPKELASKILKDYSAK